MGGLDEGFWQSCQDWGGLQRPPLYYRVKISSQSIDNASEHGIFASHLLNIAHVGARDLFKSENAPCAHFTIPHLIGIAV